MKIAGIVLILLQFLALVGIGITGSMVGVNPLVWLGSLSFGIIGVILLIVNAKKKKKEPEDVSDNQKTSKIDNTVISVCAVLITILLSVLTFTNAIYPVIANNSQPQEQSQEQKKSYSVKIEKVLLDSDGNINMDVLDRWINNTVTVLEGDLVASYTKGVSDVYGFFNGYVFQGWYIDPAGKCPWNFYADRVYSDMTIYTVWKKK